MEDMNTINPSAMPANSQIRHNAYTQLKGHWLNPVLATLLYAVVVGVASNIPLLNLLVVLPLEFGFILTFLYFKRDSVNEEDIAASPFYTFKEYGRYLGGSLLVGVFTFLWTLLLIVPGIIKAYSYILTPYIMHDNPNMPVRECIRLSQKMMDGYKWKLFCLHLSFIGWMILAVLTLCIGFLWLTPYMQLAQTNFYEEIKARYTESAATL